MDELQQLALAALVHDLPALMASTGSDVSSEAQQVLRLAQLSDPVLAAILEQAEAHAMSGGSRHKLVTDQPLVSIFSRVKLDHSPQVAYHQLASLPADTAVPDQWQQLFPISTLGLDRSEVTTYVQSLAKKLGWLGAFVAMEQFDCIYAHLLALLQQYGWCLPGHSQDVTLFDHARLTSAIAVCLYHYHHHQTGLTVEAIQDSAGAERFCLLVGDLSGIQEYIFDITTIGAGGGVARRLRARSFYLSILADVLSHQIAFRFKVPLGNVIMASGGKFYVLMPNLSDAAAGIDDLRHEIDTWFTNEFNGEIAINLAHICFSGDRFQAGDQVQPGFGSLLTDLSLKLNRQKQQRGQSILVAEGGWNEPAFKIERHFWGGQVCASCRKFPVAPEPEDPETANLCEQCIRDAEIGKRLPQARYVAYYRDNTGDMPMPFGCSAAILTGDVDTLAQTESLHLLTKLNDPNIDELAAYPGTFRYLANHVPLNSFGVQLSFEDIAGKTKPERDQGRPLLGYLKADVDHLGILFAQGLQRDETGYDTAAHVAALSRGLDLFFSGWMQHLLSQGSAYQRFYTIFSGGDDLFLVGPWKKAADLARMINEQLAAFVGHNPDITLSAGVLFTKERYPISRAAKDAEEVLELSKEGSPTHPQQRNQLTVLGDTFSWAEAPAIFAEVDRLEERSAYLTSAFLHDLVEYGRLYRLWAAEGNIVALRYKAMFAYNIARNLRKGDAALYQWADSLMQSLNADKGQPNLTMEHLGLIATYLLFAKRGTN